MTAHDHRTRVPGCFRCELSADEAMTPHQAIADEFLGATVHSRQVVAQYALDALSAAGYQVVTNNLVDACRQLTVPLTKHTLQARAEALQRIRACVAILDDDDPTDVFTEGRP